MCAKLWLDKCPMFEQNRRNHWEWDKVTTIKYMRMHHLTFDDNGFIVPHTGSFNESLVEQVLFRRSHAAREGIRMSQKKYRAQTRPTRDQHIDVLPSPNMSRPATRRRLDCPEIQFVEPSLSSILPGASEAHSQSPACNSSPEVREHEAELLNVGVSETSSTQLDYIEALSPQVTFHHGPLTPPSSAGGLVPRSWKQYVKMIDDTMSCISKDDGVRHTYDTETVLSHLRIARNLCTLQYGEESCSVQRQVVRQTENAL